MTGTGSLSRWSIAIAVAGLMAGGAAGLTAQSSGVGGGCSCTISGSGSYDCATTSSCGAGQYKCNVGCADQTQ
jgi:hypothetical protein